MPIRSAPITIITGRSGSGKSTAMAAFEDTGYYCVDNMPVLLLPRFMEIAATSAHPPRGHAFVMDLRGPDFLENYPAVFKQLQSRGHTLRIIFLEAREQTLLQRYSQTRRRHPLNPEGPLINSIRAERRLLADLRGRADRVIDTSRYNVHGLKTVVREMTTPKDAASPLHITVSSFGFKYGSPVDADLVMDVRFLPNPYFVPELKALSGETAMVQEFVLGSEETVQFLKRYLDLLDYLIPLYEKEGKAYLTLAIGCTGGRHRSVAIAGRIGNYLLQRGRAVTLTHRDIDQAAEAGRSSPTGEAAA
ncbi:MAG: RNase adapter RapZ [Desulfobacterales bacterium]